MEKPRENMIIFRYPLNHIAKGKRSMGKHIKAVKPELERYAGLVQQIKDKTKERKNLLAEKKETPFYQLPKLHDLSHRIAELGDALKQYADLKAQAADMDAIELIDARLDIRPDREHSATDRVNAAYGEKYDPLLMYDSKRDDAVLLNEEAEARSVREFLRQKQKPQQTQQQRKPKRHEQKR